MANLALQIHNLSVSVESEIIPSVVEDYFSSYVARKAPQIFTTVSLKGSRPFRPFPEDKSYPLDLEIGNGLLRLASLDFRSTYHLADKRCEVVMTEESADPKIFLGNLQNVFRVILG